MEKVENEGKCGGKESTERESVSIFSSMKIRSNLNA